MIKRDSDDAVLKELVINRVAERWKDLSHAACPPLHVDDLVVHDPGEFILQCPPKISHYCLCSKLFQIPIRDQNQNE